MFRMVIVFFENVPRGTSPQLASLLFLPPSFTREVPNIVRRREQIYAIPAERVVRCKCRVFCANKEVIKFVGSALLNKTNYFSLKHLGFARLAHYLQ